MDSKTVYRRSGLVLVEILAVTVVFLVIAASALSWRLLSAPLEIEFARPYLQEALRDEDSGVYVQMDRVVLYWPGLSEPLLLGLQGASIYRPDGQKLASIDEAALGLHKAQLLLGRVRPTGLILKRPSLSVIRNEDNSFDVGVTDLNTYGPVRPEDMDEEQSDLIETILQAVADEDSASNNSILSKLRSFEIQEASLLIDDKVLDLSWSLPRADALIERESGNVSATLRVDLPGDDIDHPPRVMINAQIDPDTQSIGVDGVLEYFDVALLAQKIPELDVLAAQNIKLDARVQAQLSAGLKVDSAMLTLLSEAGTLNIAEMSPDPVAYQNIGLLAKYDGESRILGLEKLQLTLGGITVEGDAEVTLGEGEVQGPVRLEIETLDQAAIAPVWPVALAEDNAKEWIVDKLSEGRFSNLYAQGDVEAAKDENGWSVDLANLVAGFEFEGMSVDYRAPLKPVTNAKGKGTFDLAKDEIRINVESANLLDLDLSEAEVLLSQVVAEGKGDAAISLKAVGPAKSVLTYIRDEPIGVNTEIDVANAKGQANLDVKISLPTQDDVAIEDVKVSVSGTLNNADLPNVVKGLSLSGGPYTLGIEDNLLNVKGSGQLANRPITLDYSEYLVRKGAPYSMRVKALMTADTNLRDAFGIDLSSFMDGSAGVDVVYTEYGNGDADADVKADLTQSRLYVEPFDYEKPAGEKAETSLKAILKNGELKEVTNLTGTAPAFSLETSTIGFRQRGAETELSSGKVSRFTLNETVARLEFEVEQSGRTKIIMDGPFLDLRPFLNDDGGDKSEPYTAPPMEISVAVDRMRTADEETVQYAKMYADIDGQGKFNQMEMDAIAGQGDIYLRYKPDGSGKRVFRMEADDAGATLRAFDLYENVIGGKLVIYGEPIQGVFDRNLIGVAEMTNFKVVKAPALAKLLGIMSLPGLMQNLNGEGLVFTKMEANFDWLYRPQGSVLVMKDGRTSGNSLGLTFDGTFDNAARMVDVEGTIIPLSGVNKIIGDIPIVGDILTGGTGALIAATYSMKGSFDDPKTFVNPLSVLTPGILRRILFEN